MATKQVVPISGSIAFDTVAGPPGLKGEKGDRGDAGPPGKDAVFPGPSIASYSIDVTRFGVLPNPAGNGLDNSANFRKLYASLPGPATLYFPPGQYQWGETVRRDRDFVTVRGAGVRETTIQVTGSFPAFLDGVREPAADGFAFTKAGRPDAFGVLDTSISPALGYASGFATQGRSVAYLTEHALCLGRYNRTDQVWDYHGSVTGLTVRLLIGPGGSGRIPENQAIAGIGDYFPTFAPGPWVVVTGVDLGPGRGTIGLSVRLEGDPPGMQRRSFAEYGDPSKPHRITLVFDSTGGGQSVLVDGKPVPSVPAPMSMPGVVVPVRVGQPFEAQKLDWPFLMGSTGSMVSVGPGVGIPDVVFYGFWVGDKADTVDPADDKGRYIAPDCLGFFNPFYQPKDRLLRFDAGSSSGGASVTTGAPYAKPIEGRAAVLDTRSQSPNLGGQRTTDLAIELGAPAILSGVNYAESLERVRLVGGIGGFAHVRTNGGTYVTKIADAEFSGTHLGLSLFGCIARVSGVKIGRGGAYSISTCSSSVDFDNVMLTGFAPEPDGGYLIRGGNGYGNSIYGRSLLADNEGFSAFKVAYFDMDQAPTTASSLILESCEAGAIAAGGYFIKLTGYGIDAVYPVMPLVDGRNLRVPDGAAGVVYVAGPQGIWAGSVSTVSKANGTAGPGAGRVKVVGP